MKLARQKHHLILLFLIIIGALLHFTNLNWGAPFYFHPDERNVANSVSQLQFPKQMNPNFFAYGSLPIYTIYFTGVAANAITHSQPFNVKFEQAILILRLYSAFFATLLIPILFILGRKLKDERTSYIAAFLTTASTGFIQFAHFGTFEMWLTFFGALLFWVSLQFLKEKNVSSVLLMGGLFGILMATKVSSLVLFPLLFLVFLISNDRTRHTVDALPFKNHIKSVLKNFALFLAQLFLFSGVAVFVYFISNPYVILDTPAFLSSMQYESSVGLGTLPIFYTGGFYDTIPVVYQFIAVYPFLVNPLIALLFIPAFLFVLYTSIQKKNATHILLLAFFLILFFSQAFLFIKWTRYMMPTLPFVYLIIALALTFIRPKLLQNISIGCIILVSCIFAFSYFVTAFVRSDTRIEALAYAQKNIPRNAKILSEMYDLGITPFNNAFSSITLFNFYDLDDNSPDFNQKTLTKAVDSSEYIILPSQRVLQPRLQNPKKFPIGQKFYEALFNGSLGYKQIYETRCDIFCQIAYLNDQAFSFEQTASVFDHPPIYIFKKSN
jgi:4-amino-4-deoxy-L-arabinose transferase-like glycosyltransferase